MDKPETVEIPLTRGYVALVDATDYTLIADRNWCVMITRGIAYAMRGERIGGRRRTVLMHRQIMGAGPQQQVDHKDPARTLDNRRSNLRLADNTTNSWNSRKQQRAKKNGTSLFKGVSLYKPAGTWRARIQVDKRVVRLGHYKTELEAATAYDRAAKQYFGEFARPNFG